MNSLTELNAYGETPIEFTDLRGSKVIFDREGLIPVLNQGLNISSTTVSVTPGFEILEIINYQTANVRYQVTIYPGDATPLTGSTISFTNAPTHVTSSVAGNVYTLTGLRSAYDWNLVRQFTWNLPANYATKPFWYAEAKVIYYDSVLEVDVNKSFVIFDYRFYYLARMQATSSVACTLSLSPGRIRSTITSTTSLIANPIKFSGITATPPSTFMLSLNLTPLIENITTRTYTANNENAIFATNSPQIGDGDPTTTSTFTVVLSSSLGKFSTSNITTAVSPFTITGTLSSVNAALPTVKFYPTAGSSASGTYSIQLTKASTSLGTFTASLNGSAGTYPTTTTVFNSSTTWRPTNADILYGKADVLIVAGGGGGMIVGTPAGGGGVREIFDITLTATNYTLTVGAGGIPVTGSGWLNPNNPSITESRGNPGGNSSAFGYTTFGGLGGLAGPAWVADSLRAASSGYPTDAGLTTRNLGGTGNRYVFGSAASQKAGQGGAGGAGGAGVDGPTTNAGGSIGGAGYLSTITGLYYGGGGGGGGSTNSGSPFIWTGGYEANGGSGGGGHGGRYYATQTTTTYVLAAASGLQNRGGGAGGYGQTASGGSGVIVIKLHA
jgi:hypothetical protein